LENMIRQYVQAHGLIAFGPMSGRRPAPSRYCDQF
jgi:hypothetical protein